MHTYTMTSLPEIVVNSEDAQALQSRGSLRQKADKSTASLRLVIEGKIQLSQIRKAGKETV